MGCHPSHRDAAYQVKVAVTLTWAPEDCKWLMKDEDAKQLYMQDDA